MRVDVLDKGFVELIDSMGDDNTIVSAARVSHLGESKGELADMKLIEYLIMHGHTSPFEQVEFQFMVKCPIFVARQWMRHRTWSYNEVSRRYTSEAIEFHMPSELRKQDSKNKQSSTGQILYPDLIIKNIEMNNAMCLSLYEIMLKKGITREQARMVLPLNMYTSFYAKTDLHNLFHFLRLRGHQDAQYEIQVYAEAIEKIIQPIVPAAFKAWKTIQ